MKRAIVAHRRDFLAVFGLLVLGIGIGAYLLEQQRFRFPLIEATPKRLEIELDNAQAVRAGQGQTVRVAGVEVGKISGVELENGIAVVEVGIDTEYEDLIREDASALLRPKTALKDMFIEVGPGNGKVLPEGGRIRQVNTATDIDPDEVYQALDAHTRPYLKLLVSGLGKGLENRGQDLRETFRRLEPLHRDLAAVTRATAQRRGALKQLIHDYSELIDALGDQPDDLTRLVSASGSVFDALAQENQNISTAVERLPGALRRTKRTLGKVDRFAEVLRPALQSLRAPIRELDETNAAVLPFLRDTQPVIRREIRPFVRAARPFTDDLRVAARETARATPDLTASFDALNRLFNMGAYNPNGAEPVTGDNERDRRRQEGLLYWLGWAAQSGVSNFSTADGQGNWRRLTICGLPASAIGSILALVASEVGAESPQQAEALLGSGGAVEQLLQSQFGSCDFNALPTQPIEPGQLPSEVQEILDNLREQLLPGGLPPTPLTAGRRR